MAISKSYSNSTANLTATGTVEGTSIKTVSVAQSTDLALQLTGTWTATVTFEVSVDGTNWVSLAMLATTQTANATRVATATAVGTFVADVTPYKYFRAHCTAFTSGTIVVAIYRATRGGLY